ncbi:MAG: sulfatase [Planctomycetota bacterium]
MPPAHLALHPDRRQSGRVLPFLLVIITFAGLGSLGAWFMLRKSGEGAVPRFPGANVIFISIDTLRRDALGVYSGDPALSPHIDKLAKECVIFDDAIAAANNTGPSHASMFTGVSTAVHGVLNTKTKKVQAIPTSLQTLAERLKTSGYATFARMDGGYMSAALGFDRGFEDFKSVYSGLEKKAGEAMKWFDNISTNSISNKKSAFCFLHTYEAHSPYLSSPRNIDNVLKPYKNSLVAKRMMEIAHGEMQLYEGQELLFRDWKNKFKPEDFAALKGLYRECVRMADASVNSFIEGLRKSNILDKSILIITSDHGEEFGEHGGTQHEEVWEELLRVPLLIRLPGAALAGTHVPHAFSGIDLMPTLLDLLGMERPTHIEGRSHLSHFSGGPNLNQIAFAHHTIQDALVGDVARASNWKLYEIADRPRGKRIFNLTGDQAERQNLVNSNPPEAQPLSDALKMHRAVRKAMGEYYDSGRTSGELDGKLLDDLRGLGYLK